MKKEERRNSVEEYKKRNSNRIESSNDSKTSNNKTNYRVPKSSTLSNNKPTNNMLSQLKEKNVLPDILNVVLGIGIILLIIFLVFDPTNKYLLAGALCLGGFVNLLNGYRKRNDNKKSYSFILTILGMVSIMVALMIIK